MASSDTSRPLLELPGELRKRIWERVFAHHVVDLPPAPGNLNGGLPHTLDPAAPAILLVCKQTHAEAIGVYYRLSDFRAPHDFPLRMYLRQLPVAYFHLVQNISIELGRAIPNRRLNVQFSTTYIANLAQRTVLLLQQYLRDVDHPSARDITVRVSTDSAGKIFSTTPWETYTQSLLSERASNDSDQSNDSLGARVEEALAQSRFFEYDHRRPLTCWKSRWPWLRQGNCGCGMKTTE